MKIHLKRLRNRIQYGDYDYDPVHFLVLEDRRLILQTHSKVACTSIKAAVGRDLGIGYQSASGLDIHTDERWPKVYGGIPDRCGEYFFATFVRNPFSRLVSCYQDRVLYSPNSEDLKVYYFGRNPISIPANCPFSEFVRIVENIPDPLADRHFKQQSYSLAKAGRQPDFLGRFECLDEDWRWLATRFDLPKTLERLNRTDRHAHRVTSDWRDLYTPDLQARVAARYSRDLEELGYAAEFEMLGKRAA